MNLRKIGTFFHVFMFGLFVASTSYKVLAIPKTEPEKLYGGRIKFLTFIDAVSTQVLAVFMSDGDVENIIYYTVVLFSFEVQYLQNLRLRQVVHLILFVRASICFFQMRH